MLEVIVFFAAIAVGTWFGAMRASRAKRRFAEFHAWWVSTGSKMQSDAKQVAAHAFDAGFDLRDKGRIE